jgi:hypothetical protein
MSFEHQVVAVHSMILTLFGLLGIACEGQPATAMAFGLVGAFPVLAYGLENATNWSTWQWQDKSPGSAKSSSSRLTQPAEFVA